MPHDRHGLRCGMLRGMAALESLDHVIVVTRDVDAAARSTARLLGRPPTWRGEHPALGTANALFRLPNTYLELLGPGPEGAPWLEKRLAEEGEGVFGLAFGTADAAACAAELAANGLHPQAPAPGLGRDVESGAFREWTNVHLPTTDTRGLLLFAIEHRSPADMLPLAPALGDERAAVCGLDHVVVNTDDPDAAGTLYGEGLGLRLALDRSFEQWGVRLQFFRVGGVTVEVAARLDPEPRPDGTPPLDRFFGLTWQVPDADAAHARLAELSFDVSEVRAGRKKGTRVFTVRDAPCAVPTLMIEPVAV
jgi:catechol 2,3-dioxygenase-like lactoylglutathione lyase family enzyme